MKRSGILLLSALLIWHPVLTSAAEMFDIAACTAVTTADADKFIGAPLDVTKVDKKIMINAPWSHDSLCTYMPQGVNSDDPTKIARFLDVSLRFFPPWKRRKRSIRRPWISSTRWPLAATL